jgi:hypothetical protein
MNCGVNASCPGVLTGQWSVTPDGEADALKASDRR